MALRSGGIVITTDELRTFYLEKVKKAAKEDPTIKGFLLKAGLIKND
jgi:hypothetical protein